MWLKKASGGSSIGQYIWPEDDSVCEVPDWLGEQLLAVPGNDFTVVAPPSAETPASTGSVKRGKTVKE